MITCGVDVGSLSGEAVILIDGRIESYSIVRTGPESAGTAIEALEEALSKGPVKKEHIEYTVSTGYGRVVVPFADRNITEITCHARGAHFFTPTVRTILDMGGQDCKAIRCDENGKVTRFLMNDKCAAGTGRSMEVMAALLGIRLEEVGPLSLEYQGEPIKVSNTCVVFAKSEVLSLMRQGEPTSKILAGLCDGVADRVKSLVRIIGLEEDFVISGGISKNIGVVRRIEEKLGVKAQICFEPQIVGAVGAALIAADILKRKG
jgi:bzd-type benzoyl-CoA reductase Q subunit